MLAAVTLTVSLITSTSHKKEQNVCFIVLNSTSVLSFSATNRNICSFSLLVAPESSVTGTVTEGVSLRSGPSYLSEISRTTSVTDEGPTLHYRPLLFRGFASCRWAPRAKQLWHWLRTKLEIACLEAKAFTDPLKICKRKPSSRDSTRKKY